jgi:hypothetical protein
MDGDAPPHGYVCAVPSAWLLEGTTVVSWLSLHCASHPLPHAQMLVYYYTSCDIHRGVRYGPKPRQTMDIYRPVHSKLQREKHPVVIFVTGN